MLSILLPGTQDLLAESPVCSLNFGWVFSTPVHQLKTTFCVMMAGLWNSSNCLVMCSSSYVFFNLWSCFIWFHSKRIWHFILVTDNFNTMVLKFKFTLYLRILSERNFLSFCSCLILADELFAAWRDKKKDHGDIEELSIRSVLSLLVCQSMVIESKTAKMRPIPIPKCRKIAENSENLRPIDIPK